MTKEDVRAASALLELPTKDKASNPCLATMVPFDSPLTVEKLRMIEQAESGLMELGFKECRVRHHGTIARIEVPVSRFDEVLAKKENAVMLVKRACSFRGARSQGYRSEALRIDGLAIFR
jgi:uncharacterized protein